MKSRRRMRVDLGILKLVSESPSTEKSIVTSPDPLQQLRDLSWSSPQSNSRPIKPLDHGEYIKSLPSLCNEDLVWLVEYLDHVSFGIAAPHSLPNSVAGSRRYLRSHEPCVLDAPT